MHYYCKYYPYVGVECFICLGPWSYDDLFQHWKHLDGQFDIIFGRTMQICVYKNFWQGHDWFRYFKLFNRVINNSTHDEKAMCIYIVNVWSLARKTRYSLFFYLPLERWKETPSCSATGGKFHGKTSRGVPSVRVNFPLCVLPKQRFVLIDTKLIKFQVFISHLLLTKHREHIKLPFQNNMYACASNSYTYISQSW